MLHQWEPQACFSAISFPTWGNERQRHQKCVAYVKFCFGYYHCRKPCIKQMGHHKWKRGFQHCGGDFGVFSRNSNPEHRQSCLEHRHHLQSPAVDLILPQTSEIHLVWWRMGWGFIPWQFVGLLRLGSSTQTLLKAKTGDRSPTLWMNALCLFRVSTSVVYSFC